MAQSHLDPGQTLIQAVAQRFKDRLWSCDCLRRLPFAQIQLMDMVYRKAMRLSSSDVAEKGVGGIVNLETNDVNKLERFPVYMHGIWEGPFQVPCM